MLDILPGEYTISFSRDTFPTYLYLCRFATGGSERLAYLTTNNIANSVYTFTAEAGFTYYLRMSCRSASAFQTQIDKLVKAMLEMGRGASGFEPYTAEEYTIAPSEGLSIPALAGCNTVLADSGTVEITGYSDPVHIMEELTNRVAALEGAQSGV